MKSEEEMSQEYLSRNAQHCPVCGSEEIETDGPLEQDSTEAWQQVKCNSCPATWTELYKIVAISNIEVNRYAAP